MRITSVSSRTEDFGLTRPYTIAFAHTESVQNVIVQIRAEGGRVGLGAAAPEARVTGEAFEDTVASLGEAGVHWLVGRDVRQTAQLCREAGERMRGRPAARAAVDMALHDLLGQHLDLPLADVLGRVHDALATSITIGIKGVDETLAEADEYLGRGFRILKVKTGLSLEEDLERLIRLREKVGRQVLIRVDANQGYSLRDTARFFERSEALDLEFVEQPMKANAISALRELPASRRKRIAADESLLGESDALSLAAPEPACGIFNIKLMKCGGIWSAIRIAAIAETAGIRLMWGCMDESRISIAAALHAAFASPATRYLDLDGSLDLARDVAEGGFVLEGGVMRTSDAAGLGLRPIGAG